MGCWKLLKKYSYLNWRKKKTDLARTCIASLQLLTVSLKTDKLFCQSLHKKRVQLNSMFKSAIAKKTLLLMACLAKTSFKVFVHKNFTKDILNGWSWCSHLIQPYSLLARVACDLIERYFQITMPSEWEGKCLRTLVTDSWELVAHLKILVERLP